MASTKFTVDTHIFRELGELLVGRDSTALIELIKNAYDADATSITVHGDSLNDPALGKIILVDNGTGMTREDFERGFLRIASRMKDGGTRRSRLFGRRYTGAKGVGRLAAHKLASRLEIESVPLREQHAEPVHGVHAVINWTAIEARQTIDEFAAVSKLPKPSKNDNSQDPPLFVRSIPARKTSSSGTTLTLTQLRKAWTPGERARFFADVQSFKAPDFLMTRLPQSLLPEPLLFEAPEVRDQTKKKAAAREFVVQLEGEFESGDDYWSLLAQSAGWILEIRARKDGVHFAVAPSQATLKKIPDAEAFSTTIEHPDRKNGPFFDARILVREGQRRGTHAQKLWFSNASGIHIYLEGFRVLPYGEEGNDWLRLDRDVTARSRQLELLNEFNLAPEEDTDAGLTSLPNNNYYGAVFLTLDNSKGLKMLVNREGFVPEAGYDTLVKLVRTGVDLSTRTRAAANLPARRKRREKRTAKSSASVRDSEIAGSGAAGSGAPSLPTEVADLERLAKDAINQAASGDTRAAKATSRQLDAVFRAIEAHIADGIEEQQLIRVLASVGTQMAGFVHEIGALLGAAQTVEKALGLLCEDADDLTAKTRRQLRAARDGASELRRGLERQASYLVDVVTPDARRRRSRQGLASRFDAATRLIGHHAQRVGISIRNRIPEELKSPPMFRAELTTVFANLLTNAVKAAGEGGRIAASARATNDAVVVRIQNTGTRVDPTDGERWFRPFESTTTEVDPVLGQGMGLGLTITRRVLAHYGASIAFVKPHGSFSTAVEVSFPK